VQLAQGNLADALASLRAGFAGASIDRR